jgi:hypothetical protein
VALVVDDHLLIDLLADDVHGWLADAVVGAAVYTTASWYYRVASAAAQGSGEGSLSGRIAALEEPAGLAVRERLAQLPEVIGLISPRTIVPIMAGLRTPRRLNYLNAEAVAVAVLTEATIAVRTDGPLLRAACSALHIDYVVMEAPR